MPWLAFGALTRSLAQGETIVGSGAEADWRVATADLMPSHFVITAHGLNTSIRPYSKDVVVVVNGVQLDGSYHLLHDADEIAAGRGRFVYTDDLPVVDAATAESPEPADAPAYLVDEQTGLAHPLVRRSATLGRDVSNTIVIRDPRASRFHAEVRREAGGFALHSMGAAGTTLNGASMAGPLLLAEGDELVIAYTAFRFTRGPLASGVMIAPDALAMNDGSTTLPTAAGQRMTLESATQATKMPGAAAPIIVAIGVMVVGGIIVALAALVWVNWGF